MLQSLKKGIFITDSQETEKEQNSKNVDLEKITYSEHGFERSRDHNGNINALKIELNKIYQWHKDEARRNEEQKEKKPSRIKLQELKSENEELKKKNERIEETDEPALNDKIDEAKKDKRDIKENPGTVTGDKTSRVSFYIGLAIISLLTIYLFVFYSSASYSAFFKNFQATDIGVAGSIFDPQAITNALRDGFFELVLILTIPSVFIGLGYLIHKFQEEKNFSNYFKVGFFILVTFLFDCILAYGITSKIYEINKKITDPDFSPILAAQNIDFWTIIFAGFLVYIIWGFIFDFVMKAHEKLDKVSLSLRAKDEEIKNYQERIQILDKTMFKNREKVSHNKTHIKKLEEVLNSYFYNPKIFKKRYAEFMSGWIQYMNASKMGDRKVEEAHDIGERFLSNNIPETNTLEEE